MSLSLQCWPSTSEEDVGGTAEEARAKGLLHTPDTVFIVYAIRSWSPSYNPAEGHGES